MFFLQELLCFSLFTLSLGQRERIIGGTQAPIGRYPYAVSLENSLGHFCGGSLIAPDVVLSAAHCNTGESVNAVVGRYDLSTEDGDVVESSSQVQHPSYDSLTNNNDFNLIFLSRPTTADVNVVKLNQDSSIPSNQDPVEVIGWGDTDSSDFIQKLSTVLKAVEVNIVSNDQCSSSSGWVGWFSYESYEGAITRDMMCAAGSNEDSCQGDSGGPLLLLGSDENGADDFQVGVVSWGVGCGSSNFPGVYARVSSAYEWIRKEVCEKSADPPSSFQCDSLADQTPTSATQSVTSLTGSGSASSGWIEIIEENFLDSYGQFNAGGKDVKYYQNILGRSGVIRIQSGNGGESSFYSNMMTLTNPFSKFRVTFSVYANSMELTDRFCFDTMINEETWQESVCWQSYFDFFNDEWYDDVPHEFVFPNTIDSLRVRFRCAATSEFDDVLFDKIKVEGYV